ncbi:MAG: type I-A CRISPR-associated protein Cas5a [Desulfurococcaceae archaeon]
MYVAFVELDVFSGLSIFYPYTSTSAPVHPLPPPTTLLGAIAYPYMRQYQVEDVEGGSAAAKFLDYIVYAVAGCKGYVITRDVERVYQAIYQRKERWKEEFKDLWYTIAVRGIVKYLEDKLYTLYLSKNPDVLKYAYGITRIGRKEGLVVVKSVTIKQLNEVLVHASYNTSFETLFYTPATIVECSEGAYA